MTGRACWLVDVETVAVMWRLGMTLSEREAGEAKSGQAHLGGPAVDWVEESPASVVPRAVGEEDNVSKAAFVNNSKSELNFHKLKNNHK